MTEEERLERRIKYVKQQFGLSREEYLTLMKEQNNCCAICGLHESELSKAMKHARPLTVDHDHKTKAVRGLLCNRCNIGLGNFKDDPNLLASAIRYLYRNLKDVSLERLLEIFDV